MIKGVHTMFYSTDPEATRAFLRDTLGFSFTDIGDGWLIFDTPAGDMGVHPADDTRQRGAPAGVHDISFYCDDIAATVAQLKSQGVVFTMDVMDQGFGLVTRFDIPGGINCMLYQPHYQKNSG